MPPDPAATPTLWQATAPPPAHPRLTADARADVCVVGAGIAGMTAAYLLAREGRSVIVLDHAGVGGGETGRTTAHLANAMDDRFVHLENVHGADGARLAAESHGAAIDRIESIIAAEAIACDFRRLDGYLFLAPEHERELLERERDAAHRAGLTRVQLLPRAPLAAFDTGPCLRFPDQAQFHPLAFLAGLARCLGRDGGRIHDGAHVMKVEDGTPATAVTRDGHVVRASWIVIATNSPAGHYLTTMKMLPYRTFAIVLELPAGSIEPGLYWDTGDPYHYVRLHPVAGGEVLIVGGEDHQTGTKDEGAERFAALEAWTRPRFPAAGAVRHRWSGQVLEPADSLAFIGRDPGADHVFIATGDSGQGITHGVIAGILIADLIAGRENAWASLYAPGRISPRAAREYLGDAVRVGVRYLDYIRPAEADSAEQIAPGEGAVLRRGVKRVAAYRDAQGRLHERSAICTHAGCVVHWNSTEKSWDCPCHGSRFDPEGRVLNGPAATDLDEVGG